MIKIDLFLDKIMPCLVANNSEENIRLYLKWELKKFYDDAFCDGQENVLGKE